MNEYYQMYRMEAFFSTMRIGNSDLFIPSEEHKKALNETHDIFENIDTGLLGGFVNFYGFDKDDKLNALIKFMNAFPKYGDESVLKIPEDNELCVLFIDATGELNTIDVENRLNTKATVVSVKSANDQKHLLKNLLEKGVKYDIIGVFELIDPLLKEYTTIEQLPKRQRTIKKHAYLLIRSLKDFGVLVSTNPAITVPKTEWRSESITSKGGNMLKYLFSLHCIVNNEKVTYKLTDIL